jgi:hypothetical protein
MDVKSVLTTEAVMEIRLVSGIGLFIIGRLKTGGPNGSGMGRIKNPIQFRQHFRWFLLLNSGTLIDLANSSQPGDIVMGDDSGALVIPVETADEVYRVAQEIAYKEAIIEEEVRKGVPLREAREKLGYHALQSRSQK